MSDNRRGEILSIHETETFNSGFKKRTFILKTDEKYPQELKFDVLKDDVDKLDAFTVGQTVDVQFNIRGNEYNGKHFVDLTAWSIKPAAEDYVPQTQSQQGSIDDIDDDGDIY